jgi:LssY-like putative type I secretion system component LssY
MRALLIGLLTAVCLCATDRKEVDVSPDQSWTDAGIDLRPGDSITISATGTLQIDAAHTSGPDGMARAWTDLMMQYPVTNSGRGALIGRISDSPAARAFLIGSHLRRNVPIAGRLFLGINQQSAQTFAGSYHVIVERTVGTAATANAAMHLPLFTQQMLDGLPGRVTDAFGNLGDRVNFIVIGSQEKLQEALTEAGWVVVDKTRQGAILHGLISSLSKEGYVTMPMSQLILFGRVQDFGYAQADPLKVVESRHHFRIWRAPFAADGQTVWVGAGTHDIGFDRDIRTNGITHKIDPATDGERDYIGQGLQTTGLAVKEEYMTATNPVKDARTATGGGFTSDGRTLVIYLRPD